MAGKVYVPLTLAAAEAELYGGIGSADEKTALVLDTMDDGLKLVLAELLSLHRRIDEIENQANEMMSPEKMAELATGFLGGGMKV